MKAHALLKLTAAAALPGLLTLTGCESGTSVASGEDSWTGYGTDEFPYDAAGNYIGGGYESASEAPSVDSMPTPNYGADYSAPQVAATDTSDTTDYSTPTPPSGVVSAPTPAPEPTYSAVATPEPTYSAPAPAPAPSYNRYTVRRGDTLSRIARAYGTSVSAIRNANGMSSNTVIAGRTINVPGTAPSGGVASSSSSTSGGASYRVQRGDTLYGIARRFGVSQSSIRNANSLNGSTVVIGQTLRIPGASSSAVASGGGGGTHTVRSGDTLYSIARSHGTSVAALQSANGISGTNLQVGQRLRLP